jgi:hypothetical protein
VAAEIGNVFDAGMIVVVDGHRKPWCMTSLVAWSERKLADNLGGNIVWDGKQPADAGVCGH